MPAKADLHCHSTASDGTRPPAEVIRRAAAAGLDLIALTDHDTVAGLVQASQALPPGMVLLPGMELSCRRDGRSVHLLGYLFDPDHSGLKAELAAIRAGRLDRARAMVTRLAELGVPVTWEQVTEIAGSGVVGLPHVARAMIAAGAVSSITEAFSTDWIGPGGRAHVTRYALDPVHAIALVREAGGVTVLAHPHARTRGAPVSDQLITELAGAGLAGVEIAHPDHDQAQRDRLQTLASSLGLIATGGSDDHGELTGDRIGCERTAPDQLDRLLAGGSGAAVLTG